MKFLFNTVAIIFLLAAMTLTGCKQSMVIKRVDYSQPVESVLTPDEEGVVHDVQQGLKFNIKPLQYIETQDTSSVTTKEIRYIRGQAGFYYITAPDYKNVFVMSPEEGELKLNEQLTVSENGLERPAFNQRSSYILLINRESGESWEIYPDRVEQEESQMAKNEGN